MSNYSEILNNYIFSNKDKDSLDRTGCESMLLDFYISEIGTEHGVAGKVMESRIAEYFGLENDSTIHGYDGMMDGRPVEIKTERAGNSKKVNFESSYPENRVSSDIWKAEQYMNDLPYIINAALDETGKAIFVACSDTAKISDDATFWKRLDAKSPRTHLGQYDGDFSSITMMYMNPELIMDYWGEMSKHTRELLIENGFKEQAKESVVEKYTEKMTVECEYIDRLYR